MIPDDDNDDKDLREALNRSLVSAKQEKERREQVDARRAGDDSDEDLKRAIQLSLLEMSSSDLAEPGGSQVGRVTAVKSELGLSVGTVKSSPNVSRTPGVAASSSLPNLPNKVKTQVVPRPVYPTNYVPRQNYHVPRFAHSGQRLGFAGQRPGQPAGPRPGMPAAPRPVQPAAPRPGQPAGPRPGLPAGPIPTQHAPQPSLRGQEHVVMPRNNV